jgi:hypothetical protein
MGWLDTLWQKIVDLFAPSPPTVPAKTCPAGGITPQRAQEVFDKLKARKDIPFDYPPDCCYARASEMCDTMAGMGVPSRKVWTYGELHPTKPDGAPVRFPPKPAGQEVAWGYHVAPIVDVVQPDGSCRPMVMDPSLTNGPVTIDEWNRIMSGPGARIDQTATSKPDVFYRDPAGTEYGESPGHDRKSAFADHVMTRDAALTP